MHSIKLSQYKIGIKFDKDPLAVEQNNYLIKFVNVCIDYNLVVWSKNLTSNFRFKNCLFRPTSAVKTSDKENYIYRGYGITFGSAGSWSFEDNFARNVIIFGADNSSSPHSDNRKNNFLILGQGPTYGINENFGSSEEKFITFEFL